MLTALVAARAAHAQYADDESAAAEDPEDYAGAPRVGDHIFSQFNTIAWPFVGTRVTSLTSLGLAEVDAAPRAVDFDLDAEFAAMDQQVLLGAAFTEWIGIELFAGGTTFGGINREGAVLYGVNAAFTGGGTLVLRLIESERVYLSVRGEGKISHLEGLVPARVLDEIVRLFDEGIDSLDDVSLSSLRPFYDGRISTGAGEVATAIGFSSYLGLQASGRIAWRKIDIDGVENEKEGSLVAGVGLSLDLASSGVPVKLHAGGNVGWDFSDDVADVLVASVQPSDDLVVRPEVGVFYTGRQHLELGLMLVGLWGDDDRRVSGSTRVGYHW